jgi:RNA polymerase sigma factor (sigma-70 family)
MDSASWIEAALLRHEGALLAFAQRITGDLELARDVVQETFVKLCSQERAAVEPQLAEWLYTVCRNAALDVRRKRARRPEAEEHDMERHGDPTSATAALEVQDEGRRALALLARLPEKQQEVLRLRFQGGLSYKEIARVTGESMGNVGWLIHVGLKSLRSSMAGEALEGTVSQ